MFRTRETFGGSLFGSIDRSHAVDGVHIDFTPIDMLPTHRFNVTDETGHESSHFFNCVKRGLSSTTGINFVHVNGSGVKSVFNNYLPPSVQNIEFTEHQWQNNIDAPGSGGDWAVDLLKRTNPSRPSVSLPTFFGESMEDVKMLPETIRTKGETYFSPLGYQFGIVPFATDIMKMVQLSEKVDRRSRELIRLNNKGGARVMRVLEDKTVISVAPADFVAGRDPELQGQLVTTTRSRTWGVCRWKPDSSFDTYVQGGKVNRAKIRKLLLGISPDKNLSGYGRDAWNLIPFSWMADWYTNFGDLLAANQNDNLAHPENVCIMQHLLTTRTFKSAQGSVTMYRDTKIRSFPPHLQLTCSAPLLTAGQMLILSGLAYRHPRLGKGAPRTGGEILPPIG